MPFLFIMELVVIVLLIYLGITQLILPLWRGVPIFPILGQEGHLRRRLAKAKGEVVEVKLERKILETSDQVRSLRRKAHPPGDPQA